MFIHYRISWPLYATLTGVLFFLTLASPEYSINVYTVRIGYVRASLLSSTNILPSIAAFPSIELKATQGLANILLLCDVSHPPCCASLFGATAEQWCSLHESDAYGAMRHNCVDDRGVKHEKQRSCERRATHALYETEYNDPTRVSRGETLTYFSMVVVRGRTTIGRRLSRSSAEHMCRGSTVISWRRSEWQQTNSVVSGYESPNGVRNLCMRVHKTTKEFKKGKDYSDPHPSNLRRHLRLPGVKGGTRPRYDKVTEAMKSRDNIPARICMILGKVDRHNYVRRNPRHKIKKIQRVNLKWYRIWWPQRKRYVKLRLSVKGMKTVRKLGLETACKKFWVNLDKKKFQDGWMHKDPMFVNVHGAMEHNLSIPQYLDEGRRVIPVNIPGSFPPDSLPIKYTLTDAALANLRFLQRQLMNEIGVPTGSEEPKNEEQASRDSEEEDEQQCDSNTVCFTDQVSNSRQDSTNTLSAVDEGALLDRIDRPPDNDMTFRDIAEEEKSSEGVGSEDESDDASHDTGEEYDSEIWS
eukprot:GHVQ01004710.1.p1 GENE.GHVQ01004710.1~~GHVQ01004710.1.p1  ORF type:complete len:525 (+),score=49.52 GHVQ01004710.1:143-1717(+)